MTSIGQSELNIIMSPAQANAICYLALTKRHLNEKLVASPVGAQLFQCQSQSLYSQLAVAERECHLPACFSLSIRCASLLRSYFHRFKCCQTCCALTVQNL